MAVLFCTQTQTSLHLGLTYGIKFQKFPSLITASSDLDVSTYNNVPSSVCFRNKVGEMKQIIPLRRVGNYQPPNWDSHFVQSLKTGFTDRSYINKFNGLKENARIMLNEEAEPLVLFELIDALQRLGVSYHFQNEIQSVLSRVYEKHYKFTGKVHPNGEDLYVTALGFRLMRQHGFDLVQDVFDCFKDEKGNFRANLCKDTEGMLQLYEASYLAIENESTLESAREFTKEHLKKNLEEKERMEKQLALQVERALELPYHWRSPRVESRWFMELYEKRKGYIKNEAILLQLAKLDFNMVQATHQNDLQESSRWWEMSGLGRKLDFVRDRLVENFFWTIGVNFETGDGQSQGSYFRIMSTKVNSLITVIDDVYDVYGTLDELELFTSAVERWNIDEIDQLPKYMRICYLALYNTINQMANDVMKEQDVHIISYLTKAWADLCKSYLQEARWYHTGYQPTLQEYLDSAWISNSGPLILVHAYFSLRNPITSQALQSLIPYHNIIRYSSMILRLANDLGTSKEELKRGDVPKSVECYMNDTGVPESEAREHIKLLIHETWKKMNEEVVPPGLPFPEQFVEAAVNLGRMAQCMYEYGDGHGHSNPQTKDRIRKLLFESLPISSC